MNDPVMQEQNPRRLATQLTPGRLGLVLSLVLILLAVFSVTIIESGQSAVMIRSGSDQARMISAPGIYLRVPFLERVWLIDTRLKTTEQIEPQSCATADQKNLRLAAWMAWRVKDPIKFQAATTADKGSLDDRLRQTLGEAFAAWAAIQSATNILNGSASQMSKPGLAELNQRLSPLGLEAEQTGLRQVGLSEAGNDAIYTRMSTAKNRASRQLIDGLTEDERQLAALLSRQQTQVIEAAYRTAQQTRQKAEQQLLTACAQQYGQTNGFAETLRDPPRPAGKTDN